MHTVSKKLISKHRYSPHWRNVNVRLILCKFLIRTRFIAVYIISPRKKESWVGINGNEGGIAETHEESMGKGDPRPAKYQRLSREIERLCMEIRMYRLPPEQPLIQGQDFRILHLNASSQEIGRKEGGARFLIYSTRNIMSTLLRNLAIILFLIRCSSIKLKLILFFLN